VGKVFGHVNPCFYLLDSAPWQLKMVFALSERRKTSTMFFLAEGNTMSRRVLAMLAAGAALFLWSESARAENVIRLGGTSVGAQTQNLVFDGTAGTEQVLFHRHRRGWGYGWRGCYGGYASYYGGWGCYGRGYYGGCYGCYGGGYYGGYYGGCYGGYGGYAYGGYPSYYGGYAYGGYSPYYGNGYYSSYYGNGYYGNGYYGGYNGYSPYYSNGYYGRYRYMSYYPCTDDGSGQVMRLEGARPPSTPPPQPREPVPGTFPYDGGPRVPMPMPTPQPDPSLRKALDARPGSMYAAYGEQPRMPSSPAAPPTGLRLVSGSGSFGAR
jgi:hypothetical protein